MNSPNFRKFLCDESDRIVLHGGEPIPSNLIERCCDLLDTARVSEHGNLYKEEVIRLVDAHWDETVPDRIKKHREKLRNAALRSSRLTRLRQRRGLPFKSRRQP